MLRKLPILLVSLLFTLSAQAEVWQARYGVAETFDFKLYNADGTLDVDEVDGGTEVSLSCNEGAETTATNDFVDEGTFYSIALTAGEMNCERIAVVVAATTTEAFFIQTSANASAMTPTYETNVASVTTGAIDNADFATAPGASGGLLISGSNSGTTTLGALTVTGATTHTGATVHTGAVTMAAGLAITQSTANTAGLSVTGNGTGNGATYTSGSGATGNGVSYVAASTNGHGANYAGTGTGSGELATGGATGHGNRLVGGSTSGNGISTAFTAPSAPAPEWGINAAGTLSGTHSSTTADLGANAPGTISDLPGATLVFPTRNLSRAISSYDTATGIATWATAIDADITLTNADPWILFATAPGGGSLTAGDVWANATRTLTALDEDTTTLDLNATAVGSVTGAVGSVTGAVGSVTGNVGGNVVGSTASVTGAVGSVTGNVGGTVTGLDSRIPAALVSGRMDASVGAMAANVMTAAAAASDFGAELSIANRDLVVEDQGSLSLGCLMAAIGAVVSGDVATAGNNSTFEEHTGLETRVTSSQPSAGNRTVTITCPTY